MDGDELLSLLGRPADDLAIRAALAHYGVRWAPELNEPASPEDEPDWHVWRPSSARGLEFGFQDEAYLKARDPKLRGRGPLVLSSVCFYGQHEGVRPFQGQLPFGARLSDPREVLRAKLGAALQTEPRCHRRDVWDTAPHRVIAQHDSSGRVLGSLLVKLRASDWPPLEPPPPPPPSLEQIVGLFGSAWHAPQMRDTFFPLGLDACGADIARHRRANLAKAHGVQLHFFRDPRRGEDNPLKDKGAVFSSIRFLRSRFRDARPWAGALPFGLEFDEAFPTGVAKVGRPPDEANDADLDAFAVWHLETFTLHVLYSNVDNVLLAATVFRPGSYRSATDSS